MRFRVWWKALIIMAASAASLLEQVDLDNTKPSRKRLRRAIQRLPERAQTLLGLRYFEGQDWPRIAELLETTPEDAEREHVVAVLRLRTMVEVEREVDDEAGGTHLAALQARGLVVGPAVDRPAAAALATVEVEDDPSGWIIADRR